MLNRLYDLCIQSRAITYQKSSFICLNERPLKKMKNAFYFMLKAIFVPRYLNVTLHFWAHRENGLIRNIRLISKFMTSEHG